MASYVMNENDLVHYGVKGMKWGKRKDTSSRAPSSDDHTEVAALRRQETRTLSNKDLKKVNERLQLEANYARLDPKMQTYLHTKYICHYNISRGTGL